MPMDGIKFIVDEKGKKTAVIIDLEKYGEVWEDFYDYLTCLERENEPTVSLDEAEKELDQVRKRNKVKAR